MLDNMPDGEPDSNAYAPAIIPLLLREVIVYVIKKWITKMIIAYIF